MTIILFFPCSSSRGLIFTNFPILNNLDFKQKISLKTKFREKIPKKYFLKNFGDQKYK